MIKYYDTTDKRTYPNDAENRIISTDPRVANWFQPLPDNYERDFDSDNLPILIPFELKEDGTRYSIYKREGLVNVPDYDAMEANLILTHKPTLEASAYIQQNLYLDQNMTQLYWQVASKVIPEDSKWSNYINFMNELWAEYHLRKDNLTEDYDFTSFKPEEEYSFNELLIEAQGLV